MLSHLKNGQKAKKLFITYPKIWICFTTLNLLWNENLIAGYQISTINNENMNIFLRYYKNDAVITSVRYLSKPGNRLYYSSTQLCKINSNLGLLLISTDKGILSLSECKKASRGGEVLALIN